MAPKCPTKKKCEQDYCDAKTCVCAPCDCKVCRRRRKRAEKG